MKILNISKSYGDKKILDKITFEITSEKVCAILGESGCGKTTFLDIISGNIEDYQGEFVFEKDVSCGISYIFQEDALIEWMSVYQNLEYVLKGKIGEDKLKEHIEKYLKIVKLYDYKDEYIKTLSGGMKKRVGIARAFAFPSNYLFMDEAFEFLDIKTKKEILEYFKELQKKEKKTVIFVTHDIESALFIADEIVVFSKKPTGIIEIFRGVQSKNAREKEELETQIRQLFL